MIKRLSHAAQRFSAGLEQDKTWWLLVFSTSYVLITLLHAALKPLWFDELFTFHISRLPHARDIWIALSSGMDGNPPLNYFLTRASHALLGDGPIATRMPEILAFFTTCLALFVFLARRLPAVYAAIGMVFPLISAFYSYAYEARSYAVVLGACGIALVAWQGATEGPHRKLSLAVMVFGLTAAVSSHYYGILVFIAIAIGELVRSFSSRRLDAPIWICMFLAGLPALSFLGLIRSNTTTFLSQVAASPNFWSKPGIDRVMGFYPLLLGPVVTPIVICLLLLTLLAELKHPVKANAEVSPRRLPRHEIAAAIALVAAPIFVAVIANMFTGYYMDRYAIPAVAGCAILFGFLAHELGRGRGDVGAVLLVVLFGWFLFFEVWTKFDLVGDSGPVEADLWAIADADAHLPIAISNPLKFVQLSYYAPPDLSSRIVYLADPITALTRPDFVPELALLSLKDWVPLRVQDYTGFVASQRNFWVYSSSYYQAEWLISRLVRERNHVQLRGQNGSDLLFLVSGIETGAQATN